LFFLCFWDGLRPEIEFNSLRSSKKLFKNYVQKLYKNYSFLFGSLTLKIIQNLIQNLSISARQGFLIFDVIFV